MDTKIDRVTLFWLKVERSGNDGCWIWTGSLDGKGYGTFNRSGIKEKSHRQAWRLIKGEIPKHLEVCHKCKNKNCCNPNHLFLGTHRQNMEDASQKLEMRHGEDHGGSKLTDKKIIEIRNLYSTGTLSIKSIATMFGVSYTAIYCAIKHRTWRHVL